MRKLILVLMALSIFQAAKAQSKWTIGVAFNPNIIAIDYSGENQTLLNSVKETFRTVPTTVAYGGEFLIERRLLRPLHFGFGIGYRKLLEETKDLPFVDNNGTETGQAGVSVYNHENVDVPVYFRLNLFKWLYVRVGASSLLNIANNIKISSYNVNDPTNISVTIQDDDEDYQSLNLALNGGIGISFINKRVSLAIEPYYSQVLFNIRDSKQVSANFSNYGLSLVAKVGL